MSDMTTDSAVRVTVTVTGGVADVRLNRPEKRNALDPAMFEALVATGERLKSQPGLRAVVLSGEGPDFCAGLDFASFQAFFRGLLRALPFHAAAGWEAVELEALNPSTRNETASSRMGLLPTSPALEELVALRESSLPMVAIRKSS